MLLSLFCQSHTL